MIQEGRGIFWRLCNFEEVIPVNSRSIRSMQPENTLLPPEQGKVIGLVSVYICACVYK